MIDRVELPKLPNEIYNIAGEFILLFGAVEWLIANILLLNQIDSSQYEKIKEESLTQKYFELLLEMNWSRKLDQLKLTGFDTANLNGIGKYRNTITHGLIYKKEEVFSIKSISKPKSEPKELSKNELLKNLDLLKNEGGKLLNLINPKGYSYFSPNE